MANTGSARSIATKAPVPWGLAALLLAAPMAAPPAASAAPPAPVPNADPAFPFSREIEAFAKANSAGPPVRDATLFLGSSSIRLWDIAGSFRDIRTVNRGFGGATTPHVLHYYKRLLPPVAPRAIVVYVGENDLAAGAAPETVFFDHRLHDRLTSMNSTSPDVGV